MLNIAQKCQLHCIPGNLAPSRHSRAHGGPVSHLRNATGNVALASKLYARIVARLFFFWAAAACTRTFIEIVRNQASGMCVLNNMLRTCGVLNSLKTALATATTATAAAAAAVRSTRITSEHTRRFIGRQWRRRREIRVCLGKRSCRSQSA